MICLINVQIDLIANERNQSSISLCQFKLLRFICNDVDLELFLN